MQPPIFCCNSSPSCVSYMQKKKRFTVLGGWYLRISSPIFIARKYITLTLRLYPCIMYVQAKPMRFYRARVFGQAPKFLPKIQALCLCRAPFAFPHFAKVGKIGQMRKGIFILWILQILISSNLVSKLAVFETKDMLTRWEKGAHYAGTI